MLLIVVVILIVTKVDARPKQEEQTHTRQKKTVDEVRLTCRTMCDGMYKLCDENVRHAEHVEETKNFGELLLCLKVKSDCIDRCLNKKGIFKPSKKMGGGDGDKIGKFLKIKLSWF